MVQLSVKDFEVVRVNRRDIEQFTEHWHYSHSINGLSCRYCFGLYRMDDEQFPTLIGAAIYGKPAMRGQGPKWHPDNPTSVLELRRLVCIDDTPKNTESYFIGQTLRWIRNNTDYELILSLADPYYGHSGTIYRATNFVYLGESAGDKVVSIAGKMWHPRVITMNKPFARTLQRKIKAGHESIEWIDKPGKHVYGFWLRKNKRIRPQPKSIQPSFQEWFDEQ